MAEYDDKQVREEGDFQYHLLYIPRGIQRLEKLGEYRTYPKDFELNDPDRMSDCCYIVKSGGVVAYEITYDGENRIYNIMEPGSMIMEDCVLFDKCCPVRFKTLEKSVLVRIDKCALKRAMKHDIDIVLDVCESLSTKFLSSMEHLRTGPRQSATWKICKMLLIYAEHYGAVRADGSIVLTRKVSQQMLADILGMNRVTVTRKLKELRELGLMDSENGRLSFRDTEEIRKYMMQLEEGAE